MKRMSLLIVLILLGAGLLVFAYADQDRDSRRGGYGMGPGMGYGMQDGGGYGMGPGMGYGMGHGMGYGMQGGMGFGMEPGMMPFWDKLPEAKQKQIENLHRSMRPAMMAKMIESRDKALKLREIMHKFPLDPKAAQAQWKSLNQTREESFKLRLGMVSQMQQIVGEALWQEVANSWNQRPYNRSRR